jgi:hypothetical protein
MALRAIATAENQVRHGTVFDLEDQAEGGRRVWSAKVADPDGRQFSLMISHDGSSVVSINEDKTSEDDVRNLRSPLVAPQRTTAISAARAIRLRGVLEQADAGRSS